jgi:hypothetical protein
VVDEAKWYIPGHAALVFGAVKGEANNRQ